MDWEVVSDHSLVHLKCLKKSICLHHHGNILLEYLSDSYLNNLVQPPTCSMHVGYLKQPHSSSYIEVSHAELSEGNWNKLGYLIKYPLPHTYASNGHHSRHEVHVVTWCSVLHTSGILNQQLCPKSSHKSGLAWLVWQVRFWPYHFQSPYDQQARRGLYSRGGMHGTYVVALN